MPLIWILIQEKHEKTILFSDDKSGFHFDRMRESIGRVGRGGFRKRLYGWLAGTFGMQIHSFGDEG